MKKAQFERHDGVKCVLFHLQIMTNNNKRAKNYEYIRHLDIKVIFIFLTLIRQICVRKHDYYSLSLRFSIHFSHHAPIFNSYPL